MRWRTLLPSSIRRIFRNSLQYPYLTMSASLETINLPHLPLPVHVALYRDVQNAPFLRQQLIAGNSDFEYALLDASMVYTHPMSHI